jgi:hypothetical protein
MKEWLSIQDLQAELGVSRATAYRMAANLPMCRFGSSLRIKNSVLEDYIASHNGRVSTTPPVKRGRPKKKHNNGRNTTSASIKATPAPAANQTVEPIQEPTT